MNKYY